MADDLKIKLGLDASPLLDSLKRASGSLEDVFKKVKDSSQLAKNELNSLDGKKVDIDSKPAIDKIKDVEDKAKKSSSNIGEQFKGAFLGGLASGGVTAAISGITNGIQAFGSKIVDGAKDADEFGDSLEAAFTQQGIKNVDGEIEKVRKSTLNLANDLGLPTERTRELATRVAQLGGVSGKQAEDLTKLSAGLEVFSGGAVKGEAVAKAFSRGLADPEGAAAIDQLSKKYPQLAETLKSNLSPAEKMAKANEVLGASFETVKNQQGDVGGSLNKLSNIFNESFENIGTQLLDAFTPIASNLVPLLETAIPAAMKFITDIFIQAKDIFASTFSTAASTGGDFMSTLKTVGEILYSAIILMLQETALILKTVWDLFVYAFDGIMKAIQPAIDRMGGLSNITQSISVYMKVLWGIIESLGKYIIDILLGYISLFIDSLVGLYDAGVAVYKWIVDLKNVANGLGALFESIGGTIMKLWQALKNLDFTSITDIIKNGFKDAGDAYNKAADAGRQAQNIHTEATTKIKSNNEEIAKSETDLNNKKKTLNKDPNAKPPKPSQDPSEFVRAKEQYSKFLSDLELDRLEYAKKLKSQGLDEETIKLKLQQDPNLSPTAEAMEQKITNIFKTKRDTDGNLILGVKLGAKENQENSINEVRKLFIDADKYAVLQPKIKANIDDNAKNNLIKEISDFLKETVATTKDFETFSESFIPNPVKTQEALINIENQYNNLKDYLINLNKELDDKKLLALSLGDNKLAAEIEKSKESNSKLINETKLRFERFSADSKKAIDDNNIFTQSGLALQSALQDIFNADKIKKENETNKKIREDKLNALNTESTDLQNALAKREITAEEYAAKITEINKNRSDVENDQNNVNVKRFKQAGDRTIAEVLKSQAAAKRETMNNSKDLNEYDKAYGNFLANTMDGFATLAASGTATLADFGKMSVQIAFETLTKLIPIFITEIAGKSFAQGPYGIVLAGVLTAALYGLYGKAQGAIGYKDGVVGLNGEGTETSDSIPAWLSRGESVITAKATKNNKDELDFMNRTGLSISEYYKNNLQLSSINVNSDGELIREIRLLRNDTKNLGVKIQKNTSVEINGKLIADGKSIQALIDSENKRTARG